jgi:hypothetical protein
VAFAADFLGAAFFAAAFFATAFRAVAFFAVAFFCVEALPAAAVAGPVRVAWPPAVDAAAGASPLPSAGSA